MTTKDEVQNIIAELIKLHGEEYDLKLKYIEDEDNSIDIRYKGELITIQII